MTLSTSSAKKKRSIPLWAVAFWLLCWEAAARWVDEPILLVSPLQAIQRFFQLLWQPQFWQSVGFSLGHILLGFFLSLALALVLAVLSYRHRWVRQLLSPLTATVKAIPVASFVILALLWVPSRNLSILISLMIAFPVLYQNTLTGLCHTDPQLLEMARLFRVPFARRLWGIYLPSAIPYLRSGMNIAIGLCWKSGVAAEVIGLPNGSIGDALYRAKITLSTGELFAWTFVIILLSAGFEKLFLLLLDCVTRAVTGEVPQC
mgnify:CR=1 FL=1